jgi:hypothetical protein
MESKLNWVEVERKISDEFIKNVNIGKMIDHSGKDSK